VLSGLDLLSSCVPECISFAAADGGNGVKERGKEEGGCGEDEEGCPPYCD